MISTTTLLYTLIATALIASIIYGLHEEDLIQSFFALVICLVVIMTAGCITNHVISRYGKPGEESVTAKSVHDVSLNSGLSSSDLYVTYITEEGTINNVYAQKANITCDIKDIDQLYIRTIKKSLGPVYREENSYVFGAAEQR